VWRTKGSLRKEWGMKVDVVRAWKDEEYRASLTDSERALLPPNPAGLIELEDEEMKAVLGGGTGGSSCFRLCTCPPP
jgi:mersacidin/lichenicidin family type 2 lantibiotic